MSSLPPTIHKLGTLDIDTVEATPVVFGGRLLRFEYVRAGYHANERDDSHFRFVDVASRQCTPAFGDGFHLGSAMVEGDEIFVYAVENWGQSRIFQFRSRDLVTWTSTVAVDLPGWTIFNTSACRDPQGWALAFEVGAPEDVVGQRFTNFFARSDDLDTWRTEPLDRVLATDRYTACPALRWHDGWYYCFYLEARPGPTYETWLARSRNLIAWELSPHNPVLAHSDEDRAIHPDAMDLNPEQRHRVATAVNLNNSDFDLCWHEGAVVITYSWGNQHGVEHLAGARFDGSLAGFLSGWF